jgi:hypothetical protein
MDPFLWIFCALFLVAGLLALFMAGERWRGAKWPTCRRGPSQQIFAEGGGGMIPFGRQSGW